MIHDFPLRDKDVFVALTQSRLSVWVQELMSVSFSSKEFPIHSHFLQLTQHTLDKTTHTFSDCLKELNNSMKKELQGKGTSLYTSRSLNLLHLKFYGVLKRVVWHFGKYSDLFSRWELD